MIDRKGLVWGFISYAMWGFFPLYWHLLMNEKSLEILAHRMLWAFVFYVIIFALFKRRELATLFEQTRRDWKFSAIASVLLTFNWGVYIYAVNSGHVLESSLAYFINPILNVVVGVVFFRESFPLMMRIAVLFAALGVAARIAYADIFPWISLSLAVSFCAYGVTKKMLKIPAMTSSVMEGAVGALPALAAVIYFTELHTTPIAPTTWMLFAVGGVVTGLPLFLFSYAAQRVPYSLMGMIQFIAPTLQFMVGVFAFHEAFGLPDLISFGLIWIGVAFYLGFLGSRYLLRRS